MTCALVTRHIFRRFGPAGVGPLPRCDSVCWYRASPPLSAGIGRRWLAAGPGGVSPEHYDRLGVGPDATSQELQAAYAVASEKCAGPLAVLRRAELAESLRAAMAVAPTCRATAEDIAAARHKLAVTGRGAVSLPQNLDSGRGQTEDQAEIRAQKAMARALAYKNSKGASATDTSTRRVDPFGSLEDSTTTAFDALEEPNPTGQSNPAAPLLLVRQGWEPMGTPPLPAADEVPDMEGEGSDVDDVRQVPHWVRLQNAIDDGKEQAVDALLRSLLEAQLMRASSKEQVAAVAKAERVFGSKASLLNGDIDELNLSMTIARFQRIRINAEMQIQKVKTDINM